MASHLGASIECFSPMVRCCVTSERAEGDSEKWLSGLSRVAPQSICLLADLIRIERPNADLTAGRNIHNAKAICDFSDVVSCRIYALTFVARSKRGICAPARSRL